jgi:hypothetical protein
MDLELAGYLVLAIVTIPYSVEVLRQVPLQVRVMAVMPPAVRAKLPPHPRRAWLTIGGSVRFFLALFRYALRDDPSDLLEMIELKRAMRRSALREGLFTAILAATVIVLWRIGWRPIWPHLPRQ